MKGACASLLAAAAIAFDAFAAVGLFPGRPKLRTVPPRGLSAISHAGGDLFYAVADNGAQCGLYRFRMTFADDGGEVASFAAETNGVVRLAKAKDIEGVAFDRANGTVWVADEAAAAIREYDPKTGAMLQSVDVPQVLKTHSRNRGLESLAMSRDSLVMWTATEEALPGDGELSSHKSGTLSRLVKFERKSPGEKFRLASMHLYKTGAWHAPHSCGRLGRRGVVDMAVLADGSLLVLERECSFSKSGTDFWAKASGSFWYAVYRIADPCAAPDVKDAPALAGRAAKCVDKELLAEGNSGLANYEGMCVGPRLKSGGRAVVLVADAGDGNTVPYVLPMRLK